MKPVTDSPSFIEGFVEECFRQGFTEKQAASMLDEVHKANLLLHDPHFKEGFEKGAMMKTIGTAIGAPLAGVAGAAIPNTYRPMPWKTEEGGGGATLKGMGMGAALAGLGTMALSKGRGVGRGGRMGKLFSDANPAVMQGGKAVFRPHRTLTAPFKQMDGKMFTNLGAGAGLGAGFGLGMDLKDRFRHGSIFGPSWDSMAREKYFPNYATGNMPNYGAGGGTSGGTTAPGGQDVFSAPKSLRDFYAAPAAAAGYAAGSAPDAVPNSPVNMVQQGQAQVRDIDRQLSALQAELTRAGDATDPGEMLRAQNIRREMNDLNRERNRYMQDMQGAVRNLHSEQTRWQNAAARDYEIANNRYNDATDSARFHIGNSNPVTSLSEVPRGILGWILGSEQKARDAVAQANRYEDIRDSASIAQNTSFF